MTYKLLMPEMGEGVIEGTISQWLKQEGDYVNQYEPILEIETDKVTTEATAEQAGTLLKIYVQEGETVPVGTVLAIIGSEEDTVPDDASHSGQTTALQPEPEPVTVKMETAAAAPAATPPQPAAPQNGSTSPASTEFVPTGFTPRRYTGRISPVVGRIAAENNVSLDNVPGTGKDGRITKRDILAYLEARAAAASRPTEATPMPAPAAPTPPPAPAPKPTPMPAPAAAAVPGTIQPLTNMRRAIAEHMVRSKHTSPHVTTVFEFDFTAVSQHRAAHKAQFQQEGINLTYTAYIVAATAEALRQHPMVNSSWADNGIELKQEINIGMATALEDGLIVPVIKNADTLNLRGIAKTVNDLAQRARSKKLLPHEVQGGTFSITNHGISGSLFATPIINQPQCGILGVGIIEKRVKVINDAIAIRPMAYVSFTFDHRILDGATADYFVAAIKEKIENWT
ncbi:MAG: 2-oxoglutarate dehydrogenase, E2 component, dihydrolipoamide succinyltransferase [Candidatus Promineifilaceae bacterium]